MSFSAYVVCNCYQKGKTIEPPYKEYLKFDEDGLYLDIPTDFYDKNREKAYQMTDSFEEWRETACEHEDMKLVDEYLCNISGMASFQYIIEQLGGEDRFPILTKYLPESNDGALPNEFVQQALDELLDLEREETIEEKVALIEKSTEKLISSVDSETYRFFVFTAHYKNMYGIDKDGFFIIENVEEDDKPLSSYVMFRSKNFIQQTISKDCYRFIDIPSGEYFECSCKLYPIKEEAIDNYEFEIKTMRVRISDEYRYIIEPLKRLMKASISSGNPIHWV